MIQENNFKTFDKKFNKSAKVYIERFKRMYLILVSKLKLPENRL